MKEILEVIRKSLVQDTQNISIEEIMQNDEIKYEVKVSKEDMGRVIGKRGKVAQSIRTVMKAIAVKENKKVTIEFVD